MTPPAPIAYSIDEPLYLSFCRLAYRRAIARMAGWAALWIAIALVLLFFAGFRTVSMLSGVMAGIVAFALVMASRWFVVLPRQARKIYGETAWFQERLELTADEQGFTMNQPSGTLKGKWQEMVKWDEAPALLAIYFNRVTAAIVPKTSHSHEMTNHCRDRLIVSGLPKAGKRRK